LVVVADADAQPLAWNLGEETVIPTAALAVPRTCGIEAPSWNKECRHQVLGEHAHLVRDAIGVK
jgi:hypothetical protein